MEYLKKYIDDSGGYVIIQSYGNNKTRTVPETRPAYVAWLADGNIPEEIPYVPEPLPDLAEYKILKKNEISESCVDSLKTLFDAENTENLMFNILFETSNSLYIIDKKAVQESSLTPDEITEIENLRTLQTAATADRVKSDTLKVQVDACVSHAEVDAIEW